APAPRIHLDGEKYIPLRELRPHDRVDIHLNAGDDKSPVTITALRPVEGRGTLKEVDGAASKLVATLEAEPHPDNVPMYVPEQAKLTVNGQVAKVADLHAGDRVEVRHLKDTSGRAPRDVIRLDALRDVHHTGFVRELKSIDGKTWLVVERHGATTSLE